MDGGGRSSDFRAGEAVGRSLWGGRTGSRGGEGGAEKLPRRTANDIKSRWKSLNKKGQKTS